MAEPSPTDPKVPEVDGPETIRREPSSGLPGFLGAREPAPPAAGEDGAPVALRVMLLAVALLVAGFFLYRQFVIDAASDDNVPTATEYAWKVVTPDGQEVDLSRYKGRPIVLNIWATWCMPCLMEMPSLVALANRPELRQADVAVVLVSTDEDIEAVRAFLKRFDVGSAEVLVAAGAPPREFVSPGIPATFLIAPDGRIARREYGAMNWDSSAIAAQLAALAKAPSEDG